MRQRSAPAWVAAAAVPQGAGRPPNIALHAAALLPVPCSGPCAHASATGRVWTRGSAHRPPRAQALLFLEELASILLTPFVLYWSLPRCAPAIVEFVRDNTQRVEGIGDVCSLAAFALPRHGNPKYGSPYRAGKVRRPQRAQRAALGRRTEPWAAGALVPRCMPAARAQGAGVRLSSFRASFGGCRARTSLARAGCTGAGMAGLPDQLCWQVHASHSGWMLGGQSWLRLRPAQAARSRHGKLEKSLLSFATQYPLWEPDAAAKAMLSALSVQHPQQGSPHFPYTAFAGHLQGDLHASLASDPGVHFSSPMSQQAQHAASAARTPPAAQQGPHPALPLGAQPSACTARCLSRSVGLGEAAAAWPPRGCLTGAPGPASMQPACQCCRGDGRGRI